MFIYILFNTSISKLKHQNNKNNHKYKNTNSIYLLPFDIFIHQFPTWCFFIFNNAPIHPQLSQVAIIISTIMIFIFFYSHVIRVVIGVVNPYLDMQFTEWFMTPFKITNPIQPTASPGSMSVPYWLLPAFIICFFGAIRHMAYFIIETLDLIDDPHIQKCSLIYPIDIWNLTFITINSISFGFTSSIYYRLLFI